MIQITYVPANLEYICNTACSQKASACAYLLQFLLVQLIANLIVQQQQPVSFPRLNHFPMLRKRHIKL